MKILWIIEILLLRSFLLPETLYWSRTRCFKSVYGTIFSTVLYRMELVSINVNTFADILKALTDVYGHDVCRRK